MPKRSSSPSLSYETNPAYLDYARIPKLFRAAEVREDHSTPVWHYAQKAAENLSNGIGLMLAGPTGRGKTELACGLLRLFLPMTKKCLFLTAREFIQASIEKTAFSEDLSMVKAAETRDVLVLDDLAHEYRGSGSGFAETSLLFLLRTRVHAKRVTILTTNLDAKGIEALYTDVMASLVSESCIFVKVDGEDRRRSPNRCIEMARNAGIPAKTRL